MPPINDALNYRTLILSYWEHATIRRLLRMQMKKCVKRLAQKDARGWKPKPGALDLQRIELDQVRSMLDRLDP